ncbi:hypothetical protein Hanom_Chr06g00567101 [Helianthus anomalus]
MLYQKSPFGMAKQKTEPGGYTRNSKHLRRVNLIADGYRTGFGIGKKIFLGHGTGIGLGDTRPDYPKLDTRLPKKYTRKFLNLIY